MNKSIKTKNIFQDLQETHRHSIHRTRQKPKSWRREQAAGSTWEKATGSLVGKITLTHLTKKGKNSDWWHF